MLCKGFSLKASYASLLASFPLKLQKLFLLLLRVSPEREAGEAQASSHWLDALFPVQTFATLLICAVRGQGGAIQTAAAAAAAAACHAFSSFTAPNC